MLNSVGEASQGSKLTYEKAARRHIWRTRKAMSHASVAQHSRGN